MVDKYERESLGSMTQFESITDKRARQFELSLPKLSQILQEHGLNVENTSGSSMPIMIVLSTSPSLPEMMLMHASRQWGKDL